MDRNYTPISTLHPADGLVVVLMECDECGAAVSSKDRHEKWHAKQESLHWRPATIAVS